MDHYKTQMDQLWVRGGFRQSFLASSETRSLRWRQDFIRSYLEQDIPQFAPLISTETLRRFWGMLAHGTAPSSGNPRNLDDFDAVKLTIQDMK